MDEVKKRIVAGGILVLSLALAGSSAGQGRKPLRFEISFPASLRATPVDGRVLLILAIKGEPEPRLQIGEALDTQQMFGVDAENLTPGKPAVIDESTHGYPRDSLNDVPDGDYYVQAVLNVYETFHRADGHTVKLHMDQGEGQHWNSVAGQSLQRAEEDRGSTQSSGSNQDRAAQNHPAHHTAQRHQSTSSTSESRASC